MAGATPPPGRGSLVECTPGVGLGTGPWAVIDADPDGPRRDEGALRRAAGSLHCPKIHRCRPATECGTRASWARPDFDTLNRWGMTQSDGSAGAAGGDALAGEVAGRAAAQASSRKAPRSSLEERIAEAAGALKALEDEKRKRDSAAKAGNEKALRKLLAEHKLLAVDVQSWATAMPVIRKALGLDARSYACWLFCAKAHQRGAQQQQANAMPRSVQCTVQALAGFSKPALNEGGLTALGAARVC